MISGSWRQKQVKYQHSKEIQSRNATLPVNLNWTNMLQYLFCQLTRTLALILVSRQNMSSAAYSAALNQYISNKMLIWTFDMLQGLNANVYSPHTSEAVSKPTVHTSEHILYTSHLHFSYRRKGQMCVQTYS